MECALSRQGVTLMFNERTYHKTGCAVFCRTKDPFGALSNLNSSFKLTLGTFTLASSETLYQALRFPTRPELQAQILAEQKPMGSKIVAYQPEHFPHTTPLWLDGLNVTAMRASLRLKCYQHQAAIRAVLNDSADRPIVELSIRDPFWGAKPQPDNTLKGCNVLGLLWEEIRHMMNTLPPEAWLVTPTPFETLHLLERPLCDWFAELPCPPVLAPTMPEPRNGELF